MEALLKKTFTDAGYYAKDAAECDRIASETAAAFSDRGVYADVDGRLCAPYDEDNHEEWGNTAEDAWDAVASRAFIAFSRRCLIRGASVGP